MSYLKDERKLGFVAAGGAGAVGVTIGVGQKGAKKGKGVVDIRYFNRSFDGDDYEMYKHQLVSNEFPSAGLIPTKAGVLLDNDSFKELMKDFLIPRYNQLIGKD